MNESSTASKQSASQSVGANTANHPAVLDGHPVTRDEPVLDATDPAVLRGDGVFEVVRIYGGVALAMDDHLDRLSRSAAALAIKYDQRAMEQECRMLCEALDASDMYVRIVVTRLGRRLVMVEPPIAFPPVMRLLPVKHAVSPLTAGVKSLSYAANCQAKRLAEDEGCFDAVFVDMSNRVLELPFACFGAVFDDRLWLPPLDLGILDSITRRILVEQIDVEVAQFDVNDLSRASEACVIGTGMEVTPVSEVLGVSTYDATGPVVRNAAASLREAIDQRLSRESHFRTANLAGAR